MTNGDTDGSRPITVREWRFLTASLLMLSVAVLVLSAVLAAVVLRLPNQPTRTAANLDPTPLPSSRPSPVVVVLPSTPLPLPTLLPTSTPKPLPEAVAEVCSTATVVKVAALAIRTEPTLLAPRLGEVQRNETVEVLCGELVEVDQRSWVHVRSGDVEGWMNTAYLSFSTSAPGAASLAPAPDQPNMNTLTAPIPTAMSLPTEAPTAIPTELPTDVPTDVPTALSYAFPVAATTYQYGAYHHDYPATDIFCPIGSLFLAPTSGIVDFVRLVDSWDPANDVPAERGGLAVAIIGDDGVRYYGSHLSAVTEGLAPGLRVAAGQQLGLTGNSGDARSTPPHLHFGISRPTTPDDWIVRRGELPPYDYLQAWERGENAIPDLSTLPAQ